MSSCLYRTVFHPVLGASLLVGLADAQIVADPSAPKSRQPIVLRAGNGVPVVDIRAPSAAGVSRNAYRQFDVPTQGVVLNNSRGNVQTSLGGWVQGNPWLAGGGARVIVNEVDSARPSSLRGAMEVAGSRAQVVVANPSGISCDGCGFIQADRVTLTTGTPLFNGGALEGFRVGGGTVTVSGGGMDVKQVDHAQVLARAMEVNAAIWANALTVRTGTGVRAVDANGVVVDDANGLRAGGDVGSGVASGEGSPTASADAAAMAATRPSFALDVAAIGGMYAGKIFLIGSEAGLGVRNAGHLGAQAGQFTLTANGRIENTGSITASGDVAVKGTEVDNRGSILADGAAAIASQGLLANAGTVQAGGQVLLSTAGRLDNFGSARAGGGLAVAAGGALDNRGSLYGKSAVDVASEVGVHNAGLVASLGSVNISASGPGAEVRSTAASTIAAGVSDEGGRWAMVPSPASKVTIGASLVALHGQMLADGAIDVAAPAVDVSGGDLTASSIRLGAGAGDLDASRARITSTGSLFLHAAQTVRTDAAIVSGTQVDLRGGALSNIGGDVLAGERLDVDVRTLRNANGKLASQGSASLAASVIDNASGSVEARDLAVRGGSLASSGLLLGRGRADIVMTGGVANAGTIAAQGDLHLTASAVDNVHGVLAAAGDLSMTSGSLDNRGGRIAADGALRAAVVDDLDNSGGKIAATRLDLQARAVRNGAGLIDADRAVIAVGTLVNGAGDVIARDLDVVATALSNGGGRFRASGDLRMAVSSAMENQLGEVRAGGRLEVAAGSLFLNGGTIDAGGGVRLSSAGAFRNSGLIASAGEVSIAAGNVDNRRGSVQADRVLDVHSRGLVDNTDGELIGIASLGISARRLDDTRGILQSNGVMTLRPSQAVGEDEPVAVSLANDHGRLIAGSLELRVSGLSNLGGVMSADHLSVEASNLDNRAGLVQQTGVGAMGLAVSGALDNDGGRLVGNGDVRIAAGAVSNRGGSITAASVTGSPRPSSLSVRSAGAVDNTDGKIAANGRVEVVAARIDDTRGTIASTKDALAVVSTGTEAIRNHGGRMTSALGLNISGTGLDNESGMVAGGDVAIDTRLASLRNAAGAIVSAGRLDIASGALDNDAGRLQAGAALGIDTHGAGLANTRSGVKNGIVGLGGVTLRTGELDNTAGFIGATAGLSIVAEAVKNLDAGLVTGGASVRVAAMSIDNTGGAFDAAGALQLDAADVIDNSSGVMTGDVVVLAGKAPKTLVVANQRGTITAKTALAVDSARLVGAGTLSSQGSLAVRLDGDHVQTGIFEAGGDASLTVTGALVNRTLMRSGKTLTVEAADIDNTAAGEMSGKTTIVTAARTLTNRGLIDGEETRLTADAIDNVGTGRIYGDAITIQARALRNDVDDAAATAAPPATAATAVTATPAAEAATAATDTATATATAPRLAGTIASRGRLDVGVQSLVNREGALLFSMRDMAIGGALDAGGRVTGRASSVANASATIEALGTLTIAAERLANANEHFQTGSRTATSSQTKIEHALTSGARHYDSAEVRFVELLADASGYLVYQTHDAGDLAWLGNRDRRQLLLPSADYPFARFAAYYASSDATAPSGDYKVGDCRDSCSDQWMTGRHYAGNDPIWSAFGVDPDAGDPALDAALTAFRTSIVQRSVENWNYFRTTSSETTPVTSRSEPGRIASGGDMTLLADDIVNDKSRIVAGGDLVAIGASVRNLGATSTSTVRSTGTAVHTFKSACSACDEDDRVHESAPYDVSTTHQVESSLGEVVTHAAEAGARAVEARKTAGALTAMPAGDGMTMDARRGDAVGGTPSAATQGPSVIGGPATPSRTGAPSRPGDGSGLGLAEAAAVRSSIFEVAAAAIGQAGRTGSGASSRLDSSVIRTARPGITLPGSSLFHQNPAPQSAWLVETDPRFIDRRQWLGSDYLLDQLHVDAAASQKRLGDGFYEQQLLREQVAQLTGRRFLDGYGDDEAEFRALMDAGSLAAKRIGLRPGIELGADQMAALTSDIVWVVERGVTLADGSTQRVLVPQLYVRVKAGDVSGDGTLLAGRNVGIQLTGDLVNTATIAGREALVLNARNVDVIGGRISASAADVRAGKDLSLIGGTLDAVSELHVTAGRDLRIASTLGAAADTTRDSSTPASAAGDDRRAAGAASAHASNGVVGEAEAGSSGRRVALDRVAGLYVSGDRAKLVAKAGRDATLTAANVVNAGEGGSTLIRAEGQLTLDTLLESSSHTVTWDAKNQRREAVTSEVGTTVIGGGSVSLQAGGDATLRAASVTSRNAAADIGAGRDVVLEAGRPTSAFDESHASTAREFLRSHTTTTHDASSGTASVATLVSGQTTAIDAGRDIAVRGSNLVSTDGTLLVAGRNVSIEATTDRESEGHATAQADRGLFSSGGMGVTLGRRDETHDRDKHRTTARASTVGSTAGNVVVRAGGGYRQTGSDVLAPQGDIDIRAARVDIVEARETLQQSQAQSVRQAGVSLGVHSGVVDAIDSMIESQRKADAAGDTRMQLLAAANAAATARQAAATVAANPQQGGGLNASISVGASSNQSRSRTTSDTARLSSVAAGGNLSIVATTKGEGGGYGPVDAGSSVARGGSAGAGAGGGVGGVAAAGDPSSIDGRADTGLGNLVTRGARLSAGDRVTLKADHAIDLGAAQDLATQQSSNQSTSGSIGVSYGTSGLMFNASAAAGRGKANGNDVVQRNTVVTAGRQVTLSSGGDTTLRGAVVAADKVAADIGGDLRIESLQDTSTFTSRQANVGASVSIGYGQSSGSLNGAKTSVDSTFRSVGQQSGIRSGDGGFEIDVAGTTTLVGGVVASTDKAVTDGANRFDSTKVVTSDVVNAASYTARSVGVNVSGGSQGGAGGGAGGGIGLTGGGMGVGNESGSAASTTVAGISGIAGDGRVRSTDAATGLAPIFDAGRVQASVAAQAQIMQAFSRQAPKAVAEFASSQAASLDAQARAEQDPARRAELQAEAARWQEGGAYRVALHTAAGALGGGAAGAGGAALSATAVPLLDQLQAGVADGLSKAGLDPSAAKLAAQSLASLTAAGAGAAVGGLTGASTGLTVDSNNRQLHPVETQRIKELARGDPRAEQRLTQAACALVHCADGVPPNDPAYSALRALQDAGTTLTAEQALLAQQKGLDGRNFQPLFQYTTGQSLGDLLDQTQAGTRAAGAVQAGLGIAGAMGGQAACATGVGCVVGAAAMTVTADYVQAGVRTALDGATTPTQGELVLQSLGVDPKTAGAAYALGGVALGSGAAVKVADALGSAVVTKGLQAQEAVETQALLGARGVVDPRTGTPILDLKPYTNAQKGMVGEYLGEQTVRGIVPDGVKISRSQAVGQNGIDDLYKVARTDLDYLMIEYKVVGDWDKSGSSALKSTRDGLQASESWFTNTARLEKSVGAKAAVDVIKSVNANRTETWVVTIRLDGSSEIQVLDSAGKVKPIDTSKFVLPVKR